MSELDSDILSDITPADDLAKEVALFLLQNKELCLLEKTAVTEEDKKKERQENKNRKARREEKARDLRLTVLHHVGGGHTVVDVTNDPFDPRIVTVAYFVIGRHVVYGAGVWRPDTVGQAMSKQLRRGHLNTAITRLYRDPVAVEITTETLAEIESGTLPWELFVDNYGVRKTMKNHGPVEDTLDLLTTLGKTYTFPRSKKATEENVKRWRHRTLFNIELLRHIS